MLYINMYSVKVKKAKITWNDHVHIPATWTHIECCETQNIFGFGE